MPRTNLRPSIEAAARKPVPSDPASPVLGRRMTGQRASGMPQVVIEAVREMILRGSLSPGQQLRQEELAVSLGVSRNPVREALKALQIEGLVGHSLHHGYFVTQLSTEEMEQNYLMRRLLETEVLRRLPRFGRDEVTELRALNAAMAEASQRRSVTEMVQLNRRFHFRIFESTRLTFLVRELARLWGFSEYHRSLYLLAEDARQRAVGEHEAIIDAIASHDLERLIKVVDGHREAASEEVMLLLRELG